MTSYTCISLVDGVCSEWVHSSNLLNMSIEDGIKIGFMLFSCTLFAWGFREISRFIINRK